MPATLTSLRRRHKRLLWALQLLLDHKLINLSDFNFRVKKIHALCQSWRQEFRKIHPPKRRGRPKVVAAPSSDTCKRPDCLNPPATGQVYCSIQCSPFGHYNAESRKPRRR